MTHTKFSLKEWAGELAQQARIIKEELTLYLNNAPSTDPFWLFLNNIKNNLGMELEINNFADIVAQSITCGLFTMKMWETNLTQHHVKMIIEELWMATYLRTGLTKGYEHLFPDFKKLFFREVKLNRLMNLLNTDAFNSFIDEFDGNHRDNDLITAFSKHFLEVYNPKEKKKRGVFYTPTPIVAFIVRSVDWILQTEFNLTNGLVSGSKFQIIDPAMGTGTFLEFVMKEIKAIFDKNRTCSGQEFNKAERNGTLYREILPKLVGFEILMTPYIITQLKLKNYLKKWGFEFQLTRKLRCFLTNTLNTDVDTIKEPISIIIGNPPYARASANKGQYIETLMQSYKKDVRQEKNIQPLSDDYIKFLRWAQELIERAGRGIIGMVTNHTYLTGIVHAGMRKELMRVFDHIYLLDLHGSKIIHEEVPDGAQDENVFNIKQGVCIGFFIKNPSINEKKIYRFDLFGSKESKYNWLLNNTLSTTPWLDISNIRPGAPFFVGTTIKLEREYQQFYSLSELFTFYNVGGKPGDDKLLVGRDKHEVQENLANFIKSIRENKEIGKLTEAKQKLLRNWENFSINLANFEQYNYRPFDIRWTYYDPMIWTRPVKKLKEICKDNILLLSSRIVKDANFAHVFVSSIFTDVIFLSNTSSVNCFVFPLLVKDKQGKRSWNITVLYRQYLQRRGIELKNMKSIAPIAYIYAILWGSFFRTRYNFFLRQDFPRIPFIDNQGAFNKLVSFGEELMTLHLNWNTSEQDLEMYEHNTKREPFILKLVKYVGETLYINSQKEIAEIPKAVWNFRIGKYQICQKWWKDRLRKKLAMEDINSFLQLVNLIKDTLQIVRKIDSLDWDRILNHQG
ncbi:MAG: type ISP restriction/modification enzyme [Candidatus Helarchaeota archaeon]